MHETRRIAEFVAETRFDDLPSAVVQATRIYILDDLACGFAGCTTPWAGMVGELARESAPSGPCSVFSRRWTTSPSYAALVNGTMIGGFECDHAFVEGSCHPGAAVFPAALALCQRERLDGKALLLSVALGYEVACRIGKAATRAVEDVRGFHGPGTNAPFGAAAAAGKLLGLDALRLGSALGIAGSHGAGLLEFVREGSMTKRLHVGRGAQMGLESALLAARGFTGPSTVLEGDRGFLNVYSPSPRPEALLEGLGERYLLLGVTMKAYACHLTFHAVVEAVCAFRSKHSFDSGQVQRIRVAGGGRMMEPRHADPEPTSLMGAQYSLPFSVAIALCRDASDPQVFSEETLWDPQVRGMAKKVELARDDRRFATTGGPVAELSLTVAGAAHTLTASGWKGAPTNPYSFAEMAERFRRYAAPHLSAAQAEEAVRWVEKLEREGDVAELARLIQGG